MPHQLSCRSGTIGWHQKMAHPRNSFIPPWSLGDSHSPSEIPKVSTAIMRNRGGKATPKSHRNRSQFNDRKMTFGWNDFLARPIRLMQCEKNALESLMLKGKKGHATCRLRLWFASYPQSTHQPALRSHCSGPSPKRCEPERGIACQDR